MTERQDQAAANRSPEELQRHGLDSEPFPMREIGDGGPDWTPEEYAWSCADDMRGWALRAEEAASDLREQNFHLQHESAKLRTALTEIRMLTVEVGDSIEAATRACDIAMEALGE